MADEGGKDFFISYNKADRGWAVWIAWQLEKQGYSVVLQAWDFCPGGNFVLQMDEAVTHTKRTILILSPNYLDLKAVYAHAEWAASFAKDPDGQKGILLPIRVRECTPTGLLATITYIDMVDRDSTAAHNLLIAGVLQSRDLPDVEPLYPGRALTAPSALPPTPSFPGDWPEVWHVPYVPNPFFTGREALLATLRMQLATTKPTALTQAKAISGMGGIGKTQTALEYACRYRHEYRYVFWVSAATEESLRAELVQLAARLQLPLQDDHDQDETINVLKQWLLLQPSWLLILDNADNLEMAVQYLPRDLRIQGHVVLTTRSSLGGAFAQIIEVEQMNSDEGTLLLLRRAQLVASDASLEQSNQQDRAAALAIVTALDALPLALDQAGAYIQEAEISLASYLTLYQTRRKDLLAQRGEFPPGHPDTVATTWDISFQQVEQTHPPAADLLRLCAFLAPDGIPETIITQGASACGEQLEALARDPLQLNAAIKTLRNYSLIKRNQKSNTLSVHRLIQAMLQDAMSSDEQRVWAERAVRTIAKVFPIVNAGTWRNAQPYLPHADTCCSLIEQYQFSFPQAAKLFDAYGRYFYHTAQYDLAEPLYQQALSIGEQTEGPEHPSTGTFLHQLASLYQEQGKYELAEPLYQRALHISEQAEGPEHPNTGITLHELARLYQSQGKYEQAQPLYLRALRIKEHALGPEHPSTGNTLHALASLYQAQGKYELAEPLYQRALHIYEQALGPDHPFTGSTLHELARLYQNQGKYGLAEPLYQRALRIYDQAIRPEHPNIGNTLHELARLYQNQGKHGLAEPLYQRALRIYKQALGPDHPSTGNTLQALASLYQAQGKYELAEPLYQRALSINEQAEGPEHPSTSNTLQALASLYQAQGKHDLAEPLYQRALRIYEQALRPEHPNTGNTLHALASLYQTQGKYKLAEPLYQRALRISEQSEGPDHPNTGTILHNLARLYQNRGNYEQAESLYQRALRISEQTEGPDHPNTATTLYALASLYQAQGKRKLAQPLQARAQAIRAKREQRSS